MGALEKVIIDTDPGIDDAMAIFYAMAHPALDLLGLTTTFGNVSVQQATANALTLVECSGTRTPVAVGVGRPLVQPPRPFPTFVHGSDGLGEQSLPPPGTAPVAQSAAEFIVDAVLASPGEVTLVAIGPLGNLANALNLDPAIARQAKGVVVMGGAVGVPGNVSPVAEANIICDPHAADVVFAAPWPVRMVGLDVTNDLLMDRSLFRRIGESNSRVGAILEAAGDFYIRFHERFTGEGLCRGHDVAAVATIVEPDLFGSRSGTVRIVTEGPAVGQTIFAEEGHRYGSEWRKGPIVEVMTEVDAEAVVRSFETHLSSEFWN